jgi:hypothetical protein
LILLLPPSSPNTPVSFSIQGEKNPKQQAAAAAAAAPERKQREKHGYNPPPELQNAAETNTTERKSICKTPVTKPPARTEQQKGEERERTREKEVATNEHRAREAGRRPATCGQETG